jgi:iron complex outermembrane receptor protein
MDLGPRPLPLARFFTACLLAALSALYPASAEAQAPAEGDTLSYTLPEVTVEAARAAETSSSAPFAVTVETRSAEELALSPNYSLDDVLRPLSGVWVNDRHHFALGERISIRGVGYRSNFGVRGIQVVLDGVPLTLPDGQAFLDVVDPAVVRRVELVRTPASVFWGNGSGGVLFMSTRPDPGAPPVRARLQRGSFGRWQGLLEGTAAAGGWSLHGYASGVRQDGYRDHSEGGRLRAGVNARRDLGPATTLRLTAAADAQDTENPSSVTREALFNTPTKADSGFVAVDAGKQSEQAQAGVSLDHDLGAAVLSATAYGVYRSLDNPLSFGYISYDRQSGGARVSLRRQTGRLQGGVGIDVGIQADDRLEYGDTVAGEPAGDVSVDQLETVASGSVFGYTRYRITDRLAATTGVRVEGLRFEADDALQSDGDQSGERTFSAWSPSVGLSYDTGPVLVFAHYGTSFETPTASELSNRPGGGGGFNQQVEPQRTEGIEVGARGAIAPARLRFDVALFHQRIDQLLSSYRNPNGRTVFDNLGGNRHDGIEASVTWAPVEAVEVAARYTGSRFVLDDVEAPRDPTLEGNRVPGIPEHRGYLHVQVSRDDFWGQVSTELVDDYYVDNANTASAPGYTLVNLNLGHRGVPVGGARVKPFVAVENVLDERYAGSVVINAFGGGFYEPAPSRAWSAGVEIAL